MKFIDALEGGHIQHYGAPERVVETLLSKLFFFKDKVIKVYKHKEAFYGNLADFSFRKEFYAEDFFWNHAMAPDIYLRLVGVKTSGDSFAFVDAKEGEDFFIEMRKIDSSKNLTHLLNAGKATEKDMENLTHFLVEKLRTITKERKTKLRKYFNMGWHKLQDEDFEDLRQWMYMAESHIAKEDTDEMIDLIKQKSDQEKYFTEHDPIHLSVAIDGNCDNLLFLDGKPSAIDIMTPKDNWKVSDEYFNIARTAVDAYALGNKKLGDAVYRTYQKYRNEPPLVVKLVSEIRSALIQWPYRHIIGQHEAADKFKKFALERVAELKKS